MEAEIKSSGPIAPLLELLITDTTTITGDCSVDLRVNGTPAAPIIQGEATLHDASFESPSLGTRFHHINANISCQGDLIKLDSFSAEDGKEGTISATGQLLLQEQYPYRFDATVNKTLLLNIDTMKCRGHLHQPDSRRAAAYVDQIRTPDPYSYGI
jgi:autotransporter translocation and assembly factor TamB